MGKTFEFNQAPIFMTNSMYPVVLFEADPAFQNRESEGPAKMSVAIENLRFETIEEREDEFAVYMTIKLSWPEEEVPPYKQALVQAVAMFLLAPDLPKGLRERHRAMSGPSMLYSSAREFVKSLTANGPWGPILLPGMHFREVQAQEDGDSPEGE